MLSGLATSEGTARYTERFPKQSDAVSYRRFKRLNLSSIGIGTYLGDATKGDDNLYAEALKLALGSGCNVIDTAINYRHMRSERQIGATLKALVDAGKVGRDEIFVCTKGGFLPYDVDSGVNPQEYTRSTFLSSGLVDPDLGLELSHSLEPNFISHQLETSLKNLGLGSIDLYYIHNPETQLQRLSREEFNAKLASAFVVLEQAAKAGKIGYYGVATWNGFREPDTATQYLSLSDIWDAAVKAGGDQHHFGAIQLPLNLSHSEAVSRKNQFGPGKKEKLSVLYAASKYRIGVFASASLDQGKLIKFLPKEVVAPFPGLPEDVHRALQFSRSCPSVVSALVGMKRATHVSQNLQLLNFLPAAAENFVKLFDRPE